MNEAVMTAVVEMITVALSDSELAALHLVAVTDGNPRGRVFKYDVVKPLFTEGNGTRMHEVTKQALDRVVARRFS